MTNPPPLRYMTADEAEEELLKNKESVIFRKSSNPDYFTVSYYDKNADSPQHTRLEIELYGDITNVSKFLENQGIKKANSRTAKTLPITSSNWASKAFKNKPFRKNITKIEYYGATGATPEDTKKAKEGLPFTPAGFVHYKPKGGKRTRRNRRNKRKSVTRRR